jgi:hypothetical protein
MNNQGVTWADVESAKDALNRGRMPLLREQWKALSRALGRGDRVSLIAALWKANRRYC